MSSKVINYILIGDPSKKKIMTYYPRKSKKNIRIEANGIFLSYCTKIDKIKENMKLNQIKFGDSNYYFQIY